MQTTITVVIIPDKVSFPTTSNERPEKASSGATIGQNAPIQGITDPYKELIARKGYLEGAAGHISLRDPDLVQVNMKGEIGGGNHASINNADFNIHSALHQAYPDVNAACHSHTLEMLNQDACTFYNNHKVYDMFGRVAFEANEGERIVAALGNMRCAVLKDHGLLTTGKTVGEMAFLYSLMENSCRVQLLAEAAAASEIEKHICSQEEAEYTYRITTPEAYVVGVSA
ncbi:class II aldolase/adducin N-terminal [Aspergillus alliaceus]|uniref:Class II aldolase/adducin N-terminal n=1 Tax=Petromyces alliaceus TaxID=209559 RepID=A0A5N7BX84_PETAA|nr:class II aldolase/adducin N-terminal [Aspergillus alliaceus]